MGLGTKSISNIVVAMILVATMFPLALGLLANAGSYIVDTTTNDTLADVADPAVITLLSVVLPIIAVIAIITGFLGYQKFKKD